LGNKDKSRFHSQKLWFGVFTVVMLYLGMDVATKKEALSLLFEVYAGALVALATLFMGGNVASKWVQTRSAKRPASIQEVSPEQTPTGNDESESGR
jgi:multisubunit Na+/H+ antiporter MnhB subunit